MPKTPPTIIPDQSQKNFSPPPPGIGFPKEGNSQSNGGKKLKNFLKAPFCSEKLPRTRLF